MKITFKVNDNITLETTANKQNEAFQQISDMQEIFGEKSCGCCNSNNIRFNARKAKNKDGKIFIYYEMSCNECSAKLSFGQHNNNEGTLFVKRTDDPARGWAKYVPANKPRPATPYIPLNKPVEQPVNNTDWPSDWSPNNFNEEDVPF